MDDGYHWHKYAHKIIKVNLFPKYSALSWLGAHARLFIFVYVDGMIHIYIYTYVMLSV